MTYSPMTYSMQTTAIGGEIGAPTAIDFANREVQHSKTSFELACEERPLDLVADCMSVSRQTGSGSRSLSIGYVHFQWDYKISGKLSNNLVTINLSSSD
ncbi:hypothetical protein VNO77_19329 [Canavalia gladiata]|uniref:Uncharacterized protein n=1 Tax=Canavalia gladiata TaxID=3824 RepID=A0AAN9QKE3_CANGL